MNLSILLYTMPKVIAVLSAFATKWEEINRDGEISLGEWYAFGLAAIMSIGDVLGFRVEVPVNLPTSVRESAMTTKEASIDKVNSLFPESPTRRFGGSSR